ncbi:MAG: VCBS repeat-containing protein [Myxococcales bacterium]|nr:VCBS repeat-containing protein [Myxococcales bacterium]
MSREERPEAEGQCYRLRMRRRVGVWAAFVLAHCGAPMVSAPPEGLVDTPRLIAPMANGRSSVRAPTLEWQAARGSQTVTVCRTRACAPSDVVWSQSVSGGRVTVPRELAPGRYYWRVVARDSQGIFRESATWGFQVPRRSAPVETVVGTYFDADGDGYDDVVAATDNRFAALYGDAARGATWSVSDRRADMTASVGDLDGDGLSDAAYLSGCGGDTTCDRSVWVRRGARDRSEHAFWSQHADAMFAAWLCAAGDVDRDGYGDAIAVTHEQRLFVVHGGPTGSTRRSPSRSIQGISAYFFTASAAGDVDGDGFGDIVAASAQENAITARVYLGARDGIAEARSITVELAGTRSFGPAVSGAGDVNGDGYADLLVGAPVGVAPNGRGTTWLVYGGPRTSGLPTRVRLDGGVNDVPIGNVVRGVGDIDGDGFDDVAAAGGMVWGASEPRGVLSVFRGGATEVSFGATFVDRGSFGHGIAGPTDLDGDGFFDVIGHRISEPQGNGALVFRGREGAMPLSEPEVFAIPSSSIMAGPLG